MPSIYIFTIKYLDKADPSLFPPLINCAIRYTIEVIHFAYIKFGDLTTNTHLVWRIGQEFPNALSQCPLENRICSYLSLKIKKLPDYQMCRLRSAPVVFTLTL